MSRFTQAGDNPAYSDIKPERFATEADDYMTSAQALEHGVDRPVDQAPTPEELARGARRDRANVGYAKLKERR